MTRGEEVAHQHERPSLFEHSDASAKGLFIFLAALLGSVGLVLLFLWWFFIFLGSQRTFATIQPNQVPPEPRIQADPSVDIWNLRAHEDSVLSTYGWADQQKGTVRIPIDRAMDLIAGRLPSRPAPLQGLVPATGPESGGPQTGAPLSRGATR